MTDKPWPNSVVDAVAERVWDAVTRADRAAIPNLHTWQQLIHDDRPHCQKMAQKTRKAVEGMLDLVVMITSTDPR